MAGKTGAGRKAGEPIWADTPRQLVLEGTESYRMTKRQYAYAVVRGRMPASIPDWHCRLIAEGWTDEDIKRVTRKASNAICANLAVWNAMPAVQAQIEYERAIALETRLAEPLRAWEARMEKLLSMAAGELPQVRTFAQVMQDEDGNALPERSLTIEEYYESNLAALAKALEMQGRALAIFRDRQEVSGPDGAQIQVSFVAPGQAPGAPGGQGQNQGPGSLPQERREAVEVADSRSSEG